jgi:three-Cys-motif partner protein
MATKKFFEERSDQSEVKARIVSKYFSAWAQVIMPTAMSSGGKIAYIDLYAGPGRYRDGAASTPLLVLQKAIEDPKMSRMLVSIFNDEDKEKTSTLTKEIKDLPGIEKLKYIPQITCGSVDEDAALYFNKTKLIPSFSFVDPFGYRGFSLRLVQGMIKDWGCDCVFFFNYNRINAGIDNPNVKSHMYALFGEERADRLRGKLIGLPPSLRESAILEELAMEIRSLGGKFVLPFTFRNAEGTRTSHKLIFVSKHFRGYDIMKGIMAKESSTTDEGVPSFQYSPADATMPLLFSLQQPMSKLKDMLRVGYARRTLTFRTIYEEHSVDRSYIRKNYRDALKELEADGFISAYSNEKTRKKGTFPEHVSIHFKSEV